MAKKQSQCPLCRWKGDPDGRQFPPHLADDGSVCDMSTRTVPELEGDEVTGASGTVAGDGGATA